MSHEEEVRKSVAEAYGRAVTGGGSCCQPAATPVPIQLTRYDPKELETLPEGVSASSFGCGNPFAFTEIREGQVVLDLGSGAGIDLLLARRRTGASGRVIGVDMTGPMIERARASIASAGFDNVEVREGLIEKLPVESSSVDWVISNCVINLSPRKDQVFAEIARVLKPGGHMLVSDLVVSDLPPELRASAALHAACVAGAISEQEYLGGLRAAGLHDVEVRERIVYDESAIDALLGTDPQLKAVAAQLPAAKMLAGKVASVRVHARKQAQSDVAGA